MTFTPYVASVAAKSMVAAGAGPDLALATVGKTRR